jgi:NAD(P)-dependent dehydrogenase (short-subunit alcohol dehydrogenase family)
LPEYIKKVAELYRRNLFDLSGRIAIITGAYRGIGKAIAFGLANFGANVAVVDIVSEKAGHAAADQIENVTGVESTFIRADVSSRDQVRHMTEKTLKRFGKIDILCNNAGIARGGPAIAMAETPVEELLRVNFVGVFNCCREVGKLFVEQRHGKIINLASTDGEAGTVNGSVYSATKGGVISLTKALAIEWASYNIRVNAISPQVVETDMTKGRLSKKGEYEKNVSEIPLGRLLQPEDLQGAAVFLASDASDMVTGHILHVDGGYLAK